jgi:beta-glucosidase
MCRYHLGSVLNGGGSTPNSNKRASAGDWLAAADAFYDASMQPPAGLPAIPVIWGSDAVHGHSNVFGATIFPHNIGLGAANDPDLLREIGVATALEMRATGLEWTFAPTLWRIRDDRWGRTYEGYSEVRASPRSYAGRHRELEGPSGQCGHLTGDKIPLRDGPASSATAEPSEDVTSDNIDERGRPCALARPAMRRPSKQVSVGHGLVLELAWRKLHGHRYPLTNLRTARFTGFVVGDWNGHGQVSGCSNAIAPRPSTPVSTCSWCRRTSQKLYENTLAQVRDGTISEARLDDAVRRILRVKKQSGLFEAGRPSTRPHAGRQDLLGPPHIAAGACAVRESLVLLKNEAPVAVVAETGCGGRRGHIAGRPAAGPDLKGHRQQRRGFSGNLDLRQHTYRRHRAGGIEPPDGRFAGAGSCDRGVRRISYAGSGDVPTAVLATMVDSLYWLIEGCRHTRGLGFPERSSIVGKPALERISCLCRRLVAGQ